jgi:PhnB protein
MEISTHLVFPGCCQEAFAFYAQLLGGKIDFLQQWGENLPGDMPPEWRDKVAHATLKLGDARLLGADVPQRTPGPSRGFYVLLAVDTIAEADRIFAALSDGGKVEMPLQQTYWSPRFGTVVDRFGTPWEVTSRA